MSGDISSQSSPLIEYYSRHHMSTDRHRQQQPVHQLIQENGMLIRSTSPIDRISETNDYLSCNQMLITSSNATCPLGELRDCITECFSRLIGEIG
jgi:hypothetical protein